MLWLGSFAVWSFIGLLATLSVRELYRTSGFHEDFSKTAAMEFSQMLPFVPLTPLVFMLAGRYPIHRRNWLRRSLLYLVGGLVFTAGHIAMRGFTPYGVWDTKARDWRSAVWDYQQDRFKIQLPLFRKMFVNSTFDDITSTYIPILLVAYVVSYYSQLKERENLTARLEAQLVKSNLQALKSQLQPHFLFNTMHSISGLMFKDVRAADKMMTRLSELLRMSLDDAVEQITTLNRELEFVNGYLEIEKMRFGERLTVLTDIPGDTLDAQVPHLLLQPFVENAVRHGVAKMASHGQIEICSRREGENLYIKVTDNGPGFESPNGSRPKSGLGIGTSQERLRTLYGRSQKLEFATPLGGGTQVTICIPFRQKAEKE